MTEKTKRYYTLDQIIPDATAGERTQAQDEPMKNRLARALKTAGVPKPHPANEPEDPDFLAASPRPAEPPLDRLLDTIPCPECDGHGLENGYDFCDNKGAFAVPFSGPCEPPSSPEPSTGTGEPEPTDCGCGMGRECMRATWPKSGTLETLRNRIESLVNRGAEICATFKPEGAPSASAGCGTCGYSSDVHLLRDALTELRRMREENAALLEDNAVLFRGRAENLRLYDEAQDALEDARAASPSPLRSAPPDETQARGWQDIAAYEKKVDSRESVLIAVQIGEKVIVGEAYWWDAGDHDRFNDTGWWWANTAWGEHGESRIADPVLAWQPMPSPPAQTEDSQC